MIDGGVLSGPVLGGLMAAGSHMINGFTTWLSAKTEMAKRKLEMDHEAKMFPLKLEASREENAWRGFIVSQEAAKQVPDSTPWWAAAAVTLTRPALTLLLVILTTWGAIRSSEAVQGDLMQQAFQMTGIAVGWWFGNRQLGKAAK